MQAFEGCVEGGFSVRDALPGSSMLVGRIFTLASCFPPSPFFKAVGPIRPSLGYVLPVRKIRKVRMGPQKLSSPTALPLPWSFLMPSPFALLTLATDYLYLVPCVLVVALFQLPVLAGVLATMACGSAVLNMSSASSRVDPSHYSYSQDVCVETANHGMWKVIHPEPVERPVFR